jgi:exonuclease SbcC
VEPYLYASTGQLNVLALALFVAASLRQRVSRLGFMMLDEPVQNLDDIHFLAFIALVKRVALTRQVIFSTADGNIAELFRRQMKSVAAVDGQYVQYEWRSFDPKSGPDITRVDSLARGISRRTTQNTGVGE